MRDSSQYGGHRPSACATLMWAEVSARRLSKTGLVRLEQIKKIWVVKMGQVIMFIHVHQFVLRFLFMLINFKCSFLIHILSITLILPIESCNLELGIQFLTESGYQNHPIHHEKLRHVDPITMDLSFTITIW